MSAELPPLSPEEREELRRMDAAATRGPWTPGHNPTHREPLEYIAEAYSYGPPGRVHLVCVPYEDKPLNEEALFTAITGNGPTSEANARLIATMRSAVPRLLAERDALAERLADADRWRKRWHEAAKARSLLNRAALAERDALAAEIRDHWTPRCDQLASHRDALAAEVERLRGELGRATPRATP